MGDLSMTEVIMVLKPLCDSFFQDPSPEKAGQMAKLIGRTPELLVKKMDVLYSLAFHLQNNTFSKDQNIQLIEAIRAVLSKIRLDDSKLFFEIYKCLRLQICDKDQAMKLIEAHEELKETVILCMKDLVKNCSISMIEMFYVRQHAALVGHGIYLCISLARLEKSISLRIAAIETAMVLLQVHDEADMQDVVLCDQIANVIMLCLPGIVKGLLEVTLGTDTQNHKITMMAIRTWSRAVALVMQDLPQEEDGTKPSLIIKDIFKTKDATEFEKIKNVLENTKKTPEWYLTTCENFNIFFKKLDVITKNSNFKVRKELSTGVSLILLNCTRNVKSCFQTLLELLIILSEDENDEVANETRMALQKIQEKCLQDKEMKSTVEMLEENIYDLLTKMPRIIRTSGETLQLVWLNRLAGYMKILGKQRLSKILLSSAHLRMLLLTLVNIAELDCTNVSLLEDFTIIDFEETAHYKDAHSWKQFKFLFDASTVGKLYDILRCLGEFGDKKVLTDSILKMTLDLPKFKKEFILILNAILEVPMDPKEQISISKQVVEHYIASDFWDLPIKVSDEVNLQTAQHNVVQSCLLLEGLGMIAKLLQEDYQYFLLKTLYLVIEKAGSEYSLLRSIGLQTLGIIAKSQKQDTIGNLFQVNVDYISYHVTIKLRRVERNPGVLDVVGVVTTYSTMDFLPHLKCIVDDLLVQSGSNIQQRNAQSFLRVFQAFVKCVKKLTLSKVGEGNEEYFNEMRSLKASETVIKNFLDYYNAKKNASSYDVEEKIDNVESLIDNLKSEDFNECDPQEEAEEKVEIPDSIKMVKDIMKRCRHFLPSQNFTESSLAMSTLKEGIEILKDWENELLPIVHDIWHPLVDRFQNSNPLVVNHAWQLLCCLARVSKDFIRARTLKQILPTLSSFLKKSSKESYKKSLGSTYKFTQIFKLQRAVLSELGSFVKNLELFEKDTWNFLSIAESYLDCLQHPEFQECCINMYIEISNYDVDMVWIKCIDIWNRFVEPVTPENDNNNLYSKAIDSDVKSNYRQNLLKILTYIHAKAEIL